MAKVALTGADGFLGWHTKLALHSAGHEFVDFQVGDQFNLANAVAALDGADSLIHLAGANRGSDDEVSNFNTLFADQISSALRGVSQPPATISYSNSIQAELDNIYGNAKRAAGETLAAVAADLGIEFRNVLLPNLFGEHGRPFYNSFVATFCHLIATKSGSPEVQVDREVALLHAQDAADLLVGTISADEAAQCVANKTVTEVLQHLQEIFEHYQAGEIPDVSTKFGRDLFNTYRSYLPESEIPIRLTKNSDSRGHFVEIVRSFGGNGQSSFSTTVPGVTRGNHYHRRKIERFTVLAGQANIQLRRMFSDQIFTFPVTGEEPTSIDMPTGWLHNITNTGEKLLYTSFWTDDIYDPANPDTFFEEV